MTVAFRISGSLPLSPLRAGLMLLLLGPAAVHADWTGITLDLANYDSAWEFDSDTRKAQISELSFNIEEKTDLDLRVGANIGVQDFRVISDIPGETRKYNGEYISIFLRYPKTLGQRLTLHSLLSVGYHSGRESGTGMDRASYDWSEFKLQIGLGIRLGNLRIMPFVSYKDIDGDISGENGTELFEMDTPDSRGIRFDLFTEDTAYIRLEFIDGADAGGYLSFARRY